MGRAYEQGTSEAGRDLDGRRVSEAALLAEVQGLTDEQCRQPSLLPGWTVGHVVTHLARNADSATRRLEGAARGEVADQYPGGPDGRAGEIERGAHRSAGELAADLAEAQRRLDAAFDATTDDAWAHGRGRGVHGDVQPIAGLPLGRWTEVEVHRVDLGLGHTPGDWPEGLVAAWLPEVLAELPGRSDPRALLAWAIGRGGPPDLQPY